MEDQLLPLSALQHLLFCERQCALIHIEQMWDENRFTAEGRILHERVHAGGDESRRDVRIARGLRLRSLRLGLVGQADVVEFHRAAGAKENSSGVVRLTGAQGWWRPFPVEYKRGRPKVHDADRVQLCAQANCLEEMLDTTIQTGALFYGEPRRREDVDFSPELRTLTVKTAERLHLLLQTGRTPPGVSDRRCRLCSLAELCHPGIVGPGKSVARYLGQMLKP